MYLNAAKSTAFNNITVIMAVFDRAAFNAYNCSCRHKYTARSPALSAWAPSQHNLIAANAAATVWWFMEVLSRTLGVQIKAPSLSHVSQQGIVTLWSVHLWWKILKKKWKNNLKPYPNEFSNWLILASPPSGLYAQSSLRDALGRVRDAAQRDSTTLLRG